MSTLASRQTCGFVAVVVFLMFTALGFWVVRNGEPAPLVVWERSLVGRSTLVAWWLTWSCYIQVLAPIAVILLIVAWLVPAWRGRAIFSVVSLLLCWRGADLFQHLFARPRPPDWVVKHETAFSYPSSHAAIATGFYALWAVMLYKSELPRAARIAAGLMLAAFALAICWARLALGAHYLTDLLGGVLLGVTIVAAMLSIVPIKPFWAGRSRAAAE
ncbi:MAG TPA: phosphatase PAP2 family protein [Candidatus Babeliales bacterium]|nr:phosphatase PAP2 family protein [Candidatus Babeliales bacterium]